VKFSKTVTIYIFGHTRLISLTNILSYVQLMAHAMVYRLVKFTLTLLLGNVKVMSQKLALLATAFL